MGTQYQEFPNEPIIIQTLDKDFSFGTEGKADADTVLAMLDRQSEPIFFIIDFREATFSLDDLIAGANMATRQLALFKHPKMREGIFVTKNRMIELASKGLNSPIFGSVRVKNFETVDEALAYARDVIKQSPNSGQQAGVSKSGNR